MTKQSRRLLRSARNDEGETTQRRLANAFRNPNVFLLIRLNRNDYPAPSWSALQRLEQRLKQEGRDAAQQEEA